MLVHTWWNFLDAYDFAFTATINRAADQSVTYLGVFSVFYSDLVKVITVCGASLLIN